MPKLNPVQRPPRGSYEVIAAILRQEIQDGALKLGVQLPTITEIAAAHAVSVRTAHRAVALLKGEDLVAVTRGRRAVVKAADIRKSAGSSCR